MLPQRRGGARVDDLPRLEYVLEHGHTRADDRGHTINRLWITVVEE